MRRITALALTALLLAGCGNSRATAPPPTASARPQPPATVATRHAGQTATAVPANEVRASRAVNAAAVSLQAEYERSDWAAVKETFSAPRPANSLVSQMRSWRAENVRNLKITVVSRQQLENGDEAVGLEFQGDPRGIAQYRIYRFRPASDGVHIAGEIPGLTGTTYRNAGWSVTRSAHFVVYHSPYLLQGADRGYLADLEYERTEFERKFGVRVAGHIAYYWYPEQRMMAPLTHGACGKTAAYVGCADPYQTPLTIHTSEWPSYHEPIHIYELTLEPAAKPHALIHYVAPLFISEGTAVALEDRQVDPRLSDYCSDLLYVPLDACAFQAVQGLRPIDIISDTGFRKAEAGDAYALAGSFVKYLILRYGYHRFGRFYYVLSAQPKDRVKDYTVASERVFHRSLRSLFGDWRAQLCVGGC